MVLLTILKKNWIGYKDPTHINLKNYQDWLVYFNKENLILDKLIVMGFWISLMEE